MIEVEINGDRLAAKKIGIKRNGALAVLKMGEFTARVAVKDGRLQLYPDRSSAHKAVLAALQE